MNFVLCQTDTINLHTGHVVEQKKGAAVAKGKRKSTAASPKGRGKKSKKEESEEESEEEEDDGKICAFSSTFRDRIYEKI